LWDAIKISVRNRVIKRDKMRLAEHQKSVGNSCNYPWVEFQAQLGR